MSIFGSVESCTQLKGTLHITAHSEMHDTLALLPATTYTYETLMSRYRPPQAKSSPYITREGYNRMKEEEKAIWARRKVVTAAVSEAAAEGDRSENAEYIKEPSEKY